MNQNSQFACIVSCLLSCVLTANEAIPVQADCTLWKMGGGVSGCGVLARYPGPGPGRVMVERRTVLGHDDGAPPITLIKVIDPEGRTVAWSELTDQRLGVERVELTVPPGPQGIWRVSVQGGRTGDHIVFTLPPTKSWGLRGEMALGQINGLGRVGWLWIPADTADVLIEALGGGGVMLADAAGQPLPGTQEGNRRLSRWSHLPQAAVVQITVAAGTKALAIDGMPGLVCPDAASAADLRGGTILESGRIVAGPLQARARRWMVSALKRDLEPRLVFPATVPSNVRNPLSIVQLYGAYGPLSGLRSFCAAQVLDPTLATFGSIGGASDKTLHGPARTAFDAIGLAAAVAADVPFNPAHGSNALLNRATLMASYHIARLQGDDLIREGDIAKNGYPITHAFFIYLGSLAGPLPLIGARLDDEAAGVWRDGVIAVGDRLADYRGYQTNQWWHVVLGHLETYRATGEIRFRRWFERQARELIERPAGSTTKYGQHPAGYFLEEFGPDGNYDAISGTCLVEAWRDYRDLADADPTVVAMLNNAIARNLDFASCHWLPQPDGSVVGPTALVTRKVFSFADQGWPGTKLARDAFPMAAAQWQLTHAPEGGVGIGELFPHVINDDAWARRVLAKLVPLGAAAQPTARRGVPSAWTHAAIRVADLPVAAAATIPCRSGSGVWELPGQIAWKQGLLYGLVFWGVPGKVAPVSNCRIGGAPSALWSPSTGTILLSLHNTRFEDPVLGNNGVATTDDLTHACIYERIGDSLWWSGRELAALRWQGRGGFLITGRAASAGNTPAAQVSWEYALHDGWVELTAKVTSPGLATPMLNLPFLMQAKGADIAVIGPGLARFSAGSGVVDVTWEGAAVAECSAVLATGIPAVASGPVRCLRIPLLFGASSWSQRVRFKVVL